MQPMQQYPPPVMQQSLKVQLFVSCRSLKKMDRGSESDPYVRLMQHDQTRNAWVDIGTTEQQMNTPNPDFAKSI